jgi:hypothetical protein
MQDELQGSGGTVNMDWWFTNRGIILDTAGSMIFSEASASEAPEWREFLRLLKRARAHCPINGLFLVLSADSLIKDSAEKIAQKASVLAQQLDLIQRTLDVRFPVYLFVTKCDLLIGFREFFDNIDDPLLQHQMFGWSNPDPLDSGFRPDLVEQHLKGIASKVRRRRLALLREAASGARFGDTQQFYRSGGGQPARKLDEVDSLFALPESLMRLAPRLRRYLETIFVAGEWSAKPVFLRGIYFTSSMREGKALDEAIAFATGLSLDQLPEDRKWEKNRAFFLRDLFHEKVFRESGLVTRATNTLALLRQRQMAIFGSAAAALIVLTIFAALAYKNFQNSVGKEARYWQTAASGLKQGEWSWPIVAVGQAPDVFHCSYQGTNLIPGADNLTEVEYQKRLKDVASQKLSVGLIFKPLVWMGIGKVRDRAEAQRMVFEDAVLKPLIVQTRRKMENVPPTADNLERHRQALSALIKMEADNLSAKTRNGALAVTNSDQVAAKYLGAFVSYLTDMDYNPDTNLVDAMAWTYSKASDGKWPPQELLGGDHLSNNVAIRVGLENFRTSKRAVEAKVLNEVQSLNNLVSALSEYSQRESTLLAAPDCSLLTGDLGSAKQKVDSARTALLATNNFTAKPVTNMTLRYSDLEQAAKNASASAFRDIEAELPDEYKTKGVIFEIFDQMKRFASAAAQTVRDNYQTRQPKIADLDANYLVPAGGSAAYDVRWTLYKSACALAANPVNVNESLIGDKWAKYNDVKARIDEFQTKLATYKEPLPLAGPVTETCNRIASDAEQKLKGRYATDYAAMVKRKLSALAAQSEWNAETITNTGNWFTLISADLESSPPEQADKAAPLKKDLNDAIRNVVAEIDAALRNQIGFPVELNSTRSMSLSEVRNVKQVVNGLTREFRNPVWQCDASKALQARCETYVSVVDSLLDDQGNPAAWELSFLPGESDRDIIADLRFVQASFAGVPASWKDLAPERAPVSFGKAAADNAMTLSFSQDGEHSFSTFVFAKPDWGAARLIRDFSASQVNNDGTTWRFRVPLEDKAQNLHGNAVFEARLAKPLPQVKDWPKQ